MRNGAGERDEREKKGGKEGERQRKRLREGFSPEGPFLFPTILSCVPVTIT